jgi:hypothetical protein
MFIIGLQKVAMKEILFRIKDILLSPIRGINGSRREFRERSMRRLRHSPQSFVETWRRRHGYTELQSKRGEWGALFLFLCINKRIRFLLPFIYLVKGTLIFE